MPYIILVCGPSCAGKTYLANYAKYVFGDKVTVIGFDSYCVDYSCLSDEEFKLVNYDCPQSYDGRLLASHLEDLKNNKSIERPNYDFATHKRKEETTLVNPSEIIIVEGIMTFQYEELLKLADLKVFIDADEHVRFNRRFDRDQKERGRTPEYIIYQFNHIVIPNQKLYIDPMKSLADITIDNSENNGPVPVINPLINKINEVLK